MLTITTTHQPATEIGYLLGKHPDRVQSFTIPYGKAHIFYPEATEERCTVALLVEIDPIAITRGRSPRSKSNDAALQQYVNDRPYAACSHISVAIAEVFSSALNGNCADRPELAATPLPLSATITALPSRRGHDFIRSLFEPLGYDVAIETPPLDDQFETWGDSHHHNVTITASITLKELLTHLYVLIPVLDNSKHYFVGKDEADKLANRGQGWLPTHPMRNTITRQYLRYRASLLHHAHDLISRMDRENVPQEEPDNVSDAQDAAPQDPDTLTEVQIENKISLSQARINAVLEAVAQRQPKSVIDLGCGEGQLLRHLVNNRSLDHIGASDVSHYALDSARNRIKLRSMSNDQADRLQIFQSSLLYDDPRIHGYDVAVLMEVIEHVDLPKLSALEHSVFAKARPGAVIITTPNVEYNALFNQVRDNGFRHRDHRFEWTREEFRNWANRVADQNGYNVQYSGIGDPDDTIPAGHPTQMAVFTR